MSSNLPKPTALARLVRSIDWVIVTLVVAILTLALLNLDSAGNRDGTGFVASQFRGAMFGATLAIAVAAMDYRVLYRLALPAYGVGVALLVLVALVGVTTNEAERWLRIGFVQFQPSEPMKLLLVLGIARVLQRIPESEQGKLRGLLVPGLMTLVPAVLIVRQPNLSTAIVLVLIAFSMLSVTELSLRRIIVLLSTGVLAFVVAWRFFMEDYQRLRIDVWLDPEAYADKGGYQILQARTAVGAGGFLGKGVGQGTQNVLGFVPYKESDFAFAVFAEEWGFVGTSLVLVLYLALVLWAINVASLARDRFSALVCTGIAAIVFWHVILNIGVVLELFPNTGLPLPFFTHGSSNVVTIMLALGILASISRSRRR